MSLARARLAVSASFFVCGAIIASWVPHIPGVQRALGMSPGLLGLVLLSPALGAIVALMGSGGLAARIGTANLARIAILFYALVSPLTVVAPGPGALAVVLALMGLGSGALEVAMNAEAVEVEQAYGRGIMSSFHALYSLGCLAGAAIGGLVIAAHVPPVYHLIATAVVVAGLGLATSRWYLPGQAEAEGEHPFLVMPTRFLAFLGAGACCAFLVEGAVADWAALFMRDALGATPYVASLGYAAFSATMVAGRLTGDAATHALGPAGMVRLGGGLATLGLLLPLLLHHPIAAVAGFALVGAGMATVVPNFFSATSRETSMPAARAIAAVSSFGFIGFLSGPALIGGVAQYTSLSAAMGVVALFSAAIFMLAGVLRA